MMLKMSSMIFWTLVLHTCLSELDLLYPDRPCTKAKDQKAYDKFLYKHLRKDIPKNPKNLRQWQKFIDKINTWDRPVQSFFPFSEEKKVISVCSSGGQIYRGNLCISKEPLTFFNAKTNVKKKQVKRVTVQKKYVIFGCDQIQRECLPIHFEANINDDEPVQTKPNCNKKAGNDSFIPFELFQI